MFYNRFLSTEDSRTMRNRRLLTDVAKAQKDEGRIAWGIVDNNQL